ncbi:MAG: 30S ribosomal protein S21 [Clostridia bacterium]|nr:30S ribosomal protein S21 [Clostridia bacterium]
MPNPEEISTEEQLSNNQSATVNELVSDIVNNTYSQFNNNLTNNGDELTDSGNYSAETDSVSNDVESFNASVVETQVPAEISEQPNVEEVTPGVDSQVIDKEKNFNNMLRTFSMQSRGKIREVRDREAFVPPSLKDKIKSEKARRRAHKMRRH